MAGFLGNLNDLITFFTLRDIKTVEETNVTRAEAERLSRALEPIAKDANAKITFEIHGNTAPVTVNNIVVTSERANAVQNNVRRFLGPAIPQNGRFSSEVMYLQQIRGDANTSVGDRGVMSYG
ncbi:hypothetical protein ACVI1J_010504 [Bradyrhizobium diazoefficiens]